jgi:hypothetical protein
MREVKPSDTLEERPAQDSVGSLHAGHHSGLNATSVEARVGPIAGESKVFVAALICAKAQVPAAGK